MAVPVERGQKAVRAPAPEGRLVGVGRREVARLGPAGDVGFPTGIDGEAASPVVTAAAEVGREEKIGAGGGEKGHGGVVVSRQACLVGIPEREVRGLGETGHPGLPVVVHFHRPGVIDRLSAEVG